MSCGERSDVCLKKEKCTTPVNKCNTNGGLVDCNISIQLALLGTDETLEALISWYEIKNLRQYSLVELYQNINDLVIGK